MKTPFLILLFSIIFTPGLKAQETYYSYVYRDHIKTVLCHKSGWQLSYPVIKLGSQEGIHLAFDDTLKDVRDYYYTIIHCDANWQVSDLLPMDYIEGLETRPIDRYDLSFDTEYTYMHYQVDIPNQDMKPLLSGNYVIKVFENNDSEQLVLTQRFMVVDHQVSIEAEARRSVVVNQSETHQQVELTIDQGTVNISDPKEDIDVVICQNNRWDNALYGLKPTYVLDDQLIYNDPKQINFKAGNEFRHVDLKNFKFLADGIDSIYRQGNYYHYQLKPARIRAYQAYTYREDLNGKRFIKREGREDSYMEADYFYTHFALPKKFPFRDADVYVFGALTDWVINERNRMTYNQTRQCYELTLPLKQGYYTYQYAVFKHGASRLDFSETEGNFYQTENNYMIYVYHRDPAFRYDKLIGFKIVNSLKRL